MPPKIKFHDLWHAKQRARQTRYYDRQRLKPLFKAVDLVSNKPDTPLIAEFRTKFKEIGALFLANTITYKDYIEKINALTVEYSAKNLETENT